jgi:transposase
VVRLTVATLAHRDAVGSGAVHPIKLGMDRYVLTDAQWAKMEPHCLGKKSDPGRSGADNRRFIEAVLWVARTGSPWRDLPAEFGPWNTVFKRYRDWVKADVFKRLFDAASEQPDMEYAMVDATIVKVHRHGQGAKGGLRARPSANPRAA